MDELGLSEKIDLYFQRVKLSQTDEYAKLYVWVDKYDDYTEDSAKFGSWRIFGGTHDETGRRTIRKPYKGTFIDAVKLLVSRSDYFGAYSSKDFLHPSNGYVQHIRE